MISMISLQQKVTLLYCFLGFSPVVRQILKCQVLNAGSHHAVLHVQWQSHHRSPCPATAVSSHCSLPLESANASTCGARCLKWLGILSKSFKEQKECYRSESLSSWLWCQEKPCGMVFFCYSRRRSEYKVNLPQLHLSSLRDQQKVHKNHLEVGCYPRALQGGHISSLPIVCTVEPLQCGCWRKEGGDKILGAPFLYFYRKQTSVRDNVRHSNRIQFRGKKQ